MLLPTIGVVGEIPAASFICLILGLLRVPLSASAPLVFFFSFFFFLFCFGELSLEYLHFAQRHVAGNSSGTTQGSVGYIRGPSRLSDVVLPAPHLRVNGEPYAWKLNKWKKKEEITL